MKVGDLVRLDWGTSQASERCSSGIVIELGKFARRDAAVNTRALVFWPGREPTWHYVANLSILREQA